MKVVFKYTEAGINYKTIQEFKGIDLCKATNGEEVDLFLCLYGDDTEDCTFGCYNLDGTEETYLAAIRNYNSIIDKLLEKDYFEVEDLENFEIF